MRASYVCPNVFRPENICCGTYTYTIFENERNPYMPWKVFVRKPQIACMVSETGDFCFKIQIDLCKIRTVYVNIIGAVW